MISQPNSRKTDAKGQLLMYWPVLSSVVLAAFAFGGVQTSTFRSTHIDLATAAKLPSYTTAELNTGLSGQEDGWLVRCSDGDTGSKCFAAYDGTNWLRIPLGAAVAS